MRAKTKKPARHPLPRITHHAASAHYSAVAAPSYAEKLLHRRRLKWFAVLAAGLLVIHSAYNFQMGGHARALGLATDIEHAKLLDAANAERREADLDALRLDQKLSAAAQAKAQDMIAKNYWSHDSPDGQNSWEFVTGADYQYAAAGENLAYGFKTSEAVIEAWMGSKTHRANLLGSYRDAGFGYATGSYQNGTHTVVVAFFGTPAGGAQPHAGQPGPASAAFANNGPQRVLGISVVTAGAAPWGTYASLGLTAAVAIGFIVTHLELMRLGWQRTRRYLVLHPLVDAILVAVLAVIIIQTLGGFIG